MPGAWKTRARSLRVEDELWAAVGKAAASNGETITDVAVREFRRYVQANERKRTAG